MDRAARVLAAACPGPDPGVLLWLPAGTVAQAALRFGPSAVAFADSGEALAALGSLAIAERAWAAGIVLGALTVQATVVAGLLGPVAIAVSAAVPSLPAWAAWRWLAYRG